MKHIIIGRFGENDNPQVSVNVDEQATWFDFLSESGDLGHGIGAALTSLNGMGVYPTASAVDLFLLATLVYAADTRISRRTESQDGWTREIRIVLPVNDVRAFNSAKATLEKMLCFLSGDLWSLDFQARADRNSGIVASAPPERQPSNFSGVSLFSGGLDSLIGAIDELGAGRTPLFVGHAGDSSTSNAQKECQAGLRQAYPKDEFEFFRVWLQIPKGLVQDVRSEDTTRSRSFLFIAAAMMAGDGLGKGFELRVPENGLIALNVPLDPNRVGALSTRTTHPFYLARWKEVAALLGIPAAVNNPYWSATKGEMIKGCNNQKLLLSLLPTSMSCSSPAKARWARKRAQHCGYCLPCIIRRAAVLEGLGASSQDPTQYTLPKMSGQLNTRTSVGRQARSFQVAIERLKSNPALADVLILKTGSLTDVIDDRKEISQVYYRGMMEVDRILANVVTIPL